MSRSSSLERLARIICAAEASEDRGISSPEALEGIRLLGNSGRTRREFLRSAAAAAVVGAAGGLASAPLFAARPSGPSRDIAIIGAGLAGLACADELKRCGLAPSAIYEAADRVGGRCYSLRGFFPGQVAERGGELIDNLHKTMLGYAKRFSLRIEDVSKEPGEVVYYFNGQHYAESAVVDEYRQFVSAMRTELRRLSGEVTARTHTTVDEQIDNVSLLAFLEGNNALGMSAGPVVQNAIIEAYEAEYGLSAAEQSCLNFLLFIHADRRSKFRPFGIFSDERYHLVDGNDAVVAGLSSGVRPADFGMRLEAIRKTSAGRIELSFQNGPTRVHDAVVVAIPFSVLRDVDLDASLALPPSKLLAIQQLGYGTNAKMMIGFNGQPWRDLGSNGASYSDLPNHQATWETNAALASSAHAILTDYSSAARGAALNFAGPQLEAAKFLSDLDLVYPGAATRASLVGGNYLVHLEHWPSSPNAKGSYTCYRPGQFTTIAGNEGTPVGNVFFAGEHTNSFYEWQGFMEGAALSGIEAAAQILQSVKIGAL